MDHRWWKLGALTLAAVLTLTGGLYADEQRERYRGGDLESGQKASDEAREAPDQDITMQPMQGMMQYMQGMMEQMQGMLGQMRHMMAPQDMQRHHMMRRWGWTAGEDDDEGDGSLWGDMRRHGGGMMGQGGRFMRHMAYMARQLDLTEAQQAQIRDLHRSYAKAAIRSRAGIKIKQIDLNERLDAEPVKMDEVKALLDSIASEQANLRFSLLTLMQDVNKILTPEQQKKFRSMGGFMMGPGGKMRYEHMRRSGERMGYGRMERPESHMRPGGMRPGYGGMKNP